MNISDEQKKRVETAMEALAEVRTGGDFEAECWNAGIMLGHAFEIYREKEDKEHAEYLIEEGLA